ncbi:hypothetical protein MKX01_037322, partial [Papaver californicum]
MATMYLAKNALMNITKSFPQNLCFPSPSVSARKVSRVCFTTVYSSSNPNQVRYDTSAGERRDKTGYRTVDEKLDKDSLVDEASGTIEASVKKPGNCLVMHKSRGMERQAKDAAGSIKDKTMDVTCLKDKTIKTIDATGNAKKRVDMKEKTKDMAGTIEDIAKEGAGNATDLR